MKKGITQHEVEKQYGIGRERIRQYRDIVFPDLSPGEVMYFDDKALVKIQIIHFFREMEASPEEIRRIMSDPNCNYDVLLDELIIGLKNKMQKYQYLIDAAENLKTIGANAIIRNDEKIRLVGLLETPDVLRAETGYSTFNDFVASIPKKYLNKLGEAIDEIIKLRDTKNAEDVSFDKGLMLYNVIIEMCNAGIFKSKKPIKILGSMVGNYSIDSKMTRDIDKLYGKGSSKLIADVVNSFLWEKFLTDHTELADKLVTIADEGNSVEEIRSIINELQEETEIYFDDDETDCLDIISLYFCTNKPLEGIVRSEIIKYRENRLK